MGFQIRVFGLVNLKPQRLNGNTTKAILEGYFERMLVVFVATSPPANLGTRKRGHYERGLFTGGISRSSKISRFSRISRKWSDSPLFSTVWEFSRNSGISKCSRISRKWTFLKRPLFQKTPFSKPDNPLLGNSCRGWRRWHWVELSFALSFFSSLSLWIKAHTSNAPINWLILLGACSRLRWAVSPIALFS